MLSAVIEKTPWDSRVFGVETFEIKVVESAVFKQVLKTPGHYTVKIDPLSSKKILHDYGFYYCDTLIEPHCPKDRFIDWKHDRASISYKVPLSDLISISQGSYLYGRFHRDFNVNPKLADSRYNQWLVDLYNEKKVFSLVFDSELAGFFGFSKNRILLHALGAKHRGRGLAKYLWSAACRELFTVGHDEIISSISSANSAALNLYVSLGFKFRHPQDVYHRMVE